MTSKELWYDNQHETYEKWKNSIRFSYGVLNAIEIKNKSKKVIVKENDKLKRFKNL